MDWLFRFFFEWAMASERAKAERERIRQAEVKAKSDALREELEAAERRKKELS